MLSYFCPEDYEQLQPSTSRLSLFFYEESLFADAVIPADRGLIDHVAGYGDEERERQFHRDGGSLP